MKYIIFKHKTGTLMPIIIPQHITHSMVKMQDAKPINAGFFSLRQIMLGGNEVKVFGFSESLRLGPGPDDDVLLISVLGNHGIYAFIK